MLAGRIMATGGMILSVTVILPAQWSVTTKGVPIRRLDYGNLEVEVTIDAQKAYAKPWTRTINLTLVLDTDLLEYIGNENEKDLQIIINAGKAKN